MRRCYDGNADWTGMTLSDRMKTARNRKIWKDAGASILDLRSHGSAGRHYSYGLPTSGRARGSTHKLQLWRKELCRRRTTSVEPAASQHATPRSQLRTVPTKTEYIFSATRSTALCYFLICSAIELLLTYLLHR